MLARSLGSALLHRSQTRLVGFGLGGSGVVTHARRRATTSSGSSSTHDSKSSTSSSRSPDVAADATAAAGPATPRRRSRRRSPAKEHAANLPPASAAEAGASAGTTASVQQLLTSQDGTLATAASAYDAQATASLTAAELAALAASPAAAAASLSELLPIPSQQDLTFPDSSFELRDYQQDAIRQVVRQFKAGSSVQLVMLPTGTGKTVVFAALARYLAQHYVPPAGSSTSAADGGVAERGAVPAGAVAAAVVGAVTRKPVDAPAAAAAEVAGHHLEAVEAEEEATAAAAAAGDTDTAERLAEPAAVAVPPSSFRSYRRKGDIEQQQQQQPPPLPTPTSNTSETSDARVERSSLSSSDAGSTGSNGTALLASSSIDDSSSIDNNSRSSKRGRPRGAPAPTCDAGLMRVLVLAHRFELLHQAEEKFRLMWPACTVSWVKGQRKDFFGQVILASVGTAVNCIPQLAQCRFSLVVVDEAHHSVANTYKAVLRGLGFVQEVAAASSSSSSSSSSDEAEFVGADMHTDVYADASAYSGGSSSSADESQEESSEDGDAAATAAADADGNSSGRSSSARSQQLVMRAVNNPNSLCVGFTATPYRLREAESCELYEIFDNAFTRNISDMIDTGYLTKIHSRRIFTHVHLKGAGGGSGGDFVISKLSPLVNSPGRNKLVLAAFLDYCCERDDTAEHHLNAKAAAAAQSGSSSSSSSGAGKQQLDLSIAGKRAVRKAIGFAVDIEHAEALNTLFLQAGVRSGVVHSKRSIDEVKLDISRFRRGGLDVLWNCEKLTEGFDEPSISALLLARPTKSTGLYTQMLGRGLRRAPGKDNCLVLDFTDKQHKVDRVMDLRVLLPKASYRSLDPPPPQQQDRARKLKLDGLQGGEMSVLGDADDYIDAFNRALDKARKQQGSKASVPEDNIDPYDMAFVHVGEHWSISMFDSGTVWLVNIAGMGAKQRRQLGLLQDARQSADATAAAAAATADGDDMQQATAEDATTPGTSDAAAGAGSSSEDDDEQAYEQEDRFVVLHQAPKVYDACSWTNAAPSAVRGMTKSDAYGKALDYIQSLVRQQRAQQGRLSQASWKRSGDKSKPAFMGVAKVETFSKDAPWRKKPASDRQLEVLKQMKVELPAAAAAGSLTRGEASDLISQAKGALATPQQLQQLQAKLTAEQLAGLPVPLLAEHAAALGAPRSSGLPPGKA